MKKFNTHNSHLFCIIYLFWINILILIYSRFKVLSSVTENINNIIVNIILCCR